VTAYYVTAVPGIPEVEAGTDLAAVVAERADLRDGDIVVLTSKVVSKAEGRVRTLAPGETRDDAVGPETDRVVARRGPTSIVRTRHGLVMAAAGVDASNTPPGTVVLLPQDPDASARRLRSALQRHAGATLAVVVSDTSGRAWRNGQTDIAIGAAGLVVLDDHAGRTDSYGNPLVVTAPAVADQVAGAAELGSGKLSGCPVVVLHGLGRFVLPPDDDGRGAAALVRDEAGDLFGYGTRDAVVNAVASSGDDRGFGAPALTDELVLALEAALGDAATVRVDGGAVLVEPTSGDPRAAGRVEGGAAAVARAHGWTAGSPEVLRFRPRTP
jgi:coenzyme F420-0:L-glutamate ligase/coenzyme F420-1:gamma-L-glutamate ligase